MTVAPSIAVAARPDVERVGLPLLGSVFLIAGTALAYQLLLMRLLSVVHWYPFAAMIVSLALLGHGFSGSLLALCPERARRRFASWYLVCALLFALGMPLAFALAQRIPFNGLELVWDAHQLLWLGLLYLVLSLPFAAAASCFGLAFLRFGAQIPRVYAADLIGAGVGSVCVLLLMLHLRPEHWLPALTVVGALAAALGGWGRVRIAVLLPLAAAAALSCLAVPGSWLTPQPNPYKGLSATLRLPGAQVTMRRSGPLGILDVVESPRVPLRQVPGLSLRASQDPAPQLGVFVDGDGPSPVTDRSGGAASMRYLGETTSAVVYRVVGSPRVLLLGAGGGTPVLQALTLGAAAVDVVETDRVLVDLVRGPLSAFSGALYEDSRVEVRVDDPRNALRGAAESFDLITLSPPDSATGAGGGVSAAADSYLYTVEAMQEVLTVLDDDGVLSVTRWESEPPRASLKLFATAVAALRAAQVTDPGAHLMLIRDWQTSTLLVARRPFDAAAVHAVETFCRALSFELVHAPGRTSLVGSDSDWLTRGVRALMSDRADAFVAEYKFAIAPATDQRPFFHNYFHWGTLPELWRMRGQGAAVLLDSGYLVIAGTLAQAVPTAAVLILLPLWWRRRRAPAGTLLRRISRTRTALYFLALGLAFLFVEIAALSRFTLYLGAPLWSAALVLACMLVCAGVGSALSARWQGRSASVSRVAVGAAFGVVLFELIHAPLFAATAAWPLLAKCALGLGLLGPVALLMGMPFPMGLALLDARAPALVPWAWGINGFASVISALLALILAMHFGYPAVMLAAAGLYACAAWMGR